MHKLKAAARQQAWYPDADGKPNYNPFRKIRSRAAPSSSHDIETGSGPGTLMRGGTYHSADAVEPSTDINRRSEYGPDRIGTAHANTVPTQAWGNIDHYLSNDEKQNPTVDDHISSDDKQNPTVDQKDNSEDSTTTTGTSNGLVPQLDQDNGSGRKLTRRARFRGLFSKQHVENEDTDGLNRTATESSKPSQKFTIASQFKATLFNSWINVLLVMAPVGIALNYTSVPPIVVFVVNFIAIIPLAAMLSYATEEIALRTGETFGGLLNATFGNAVELIVSIIALAQNQVLIVQTSLIGSILSNLLLVLGMCFFFGGLNRVEQFFNKTVAQTASSLLALAVGSLIIPTAFSIWASGNTAVNESHITALSRGTSILLLLVYGCYLFFQLKTHASLYNEPSEKVAKRRIKVEEGDTTRNLAFMGGNLTAVGGGKSAQSSPHIPEEKEQPQLSVLTALLTLAISTALVGVCAEFLVDSINAVTVEYNVSKTFVGLILLPIVGNAAEHATAVTVACKDKMDLAIGVAVGSSMQIALFVLPFVVVLGWIMGKDTMNLSFDGFQIAVLFVAVLLVNYLIGDGKSHWLEGILLQTLYLIIAIAAWFYPENPVEGSVAR